MWLWWVTCTLIDYRTQSNLTTCIATSFSYTRPVFITRNFSQLVTSLWLDLEPVSEGQQKCAMDDIPDSGWWLVVHSAVQCSYSWDVCWSILFFCHDYYARYLQRAKLMWMTSLCKSFCEILALNYAPGAYLNAQCFRSISKYAPGAVYIQIMLLEHIELKILP